jgi:hypothetical protein
VKRILNAILLLLMFSTELTWGQLSKKVLFLGNSYTAYNNLPQLVADVALSAGDTMVFGSNAPGGYTLQGHSTDATSLSLIAAGDWDHVVLQEQSQRPSFPISQVQSSVFPYARALDSIAHALNPCVQTVFYMTWGRKNGDASNCAVWPPVCTYSGMDSLLRLRYMQMATDNDALVSPAGAVWRHIRLNLPGIELYQTDESHPSLAGSYATACAFYSVLFRKNPNLISYDAGLDPLVALQIRQATKEVTYDSLSFWLVDAYDAQASFSYLPSGLQVSFNNNSSAADDYLWDFGDGATSSLPNPTHQYTAPGNFQVSLTASNCFSTDVFTANVNVISTGFQDIPEVGALYPNPSVNNLYWELGKGTIVQLDIFSIEGLCVKSMAYPLPPVCIEDLPAGNYAARLILENGVATRYFVKLP